MRTSLICRTDGRAPRACRPPLAHQLRIAGYGVVRVGIESRRGDGRRRGRGVALHRCGMGVRGRRHRNHRWLRRIPRGVNWWRTSWGGELLSEHLSEELLSGSLLDVEHFGTAEISRSRRKRVGLNRRRTHSVKLECESNYLVERES